MRLTAATRHALNLSDLLAGTDGFIIIHSAATVADLMGPVLLIDVRGHGLLNVVVKSAAVAVAGSMQNVRCTVYFRRSSSTSTRWLS